MTATAISPPSPWNCAGVARGHKAYRTTIPADCAAPAMSICQYKNTEKSNRQYRYLQGYLTRFTGISRQITDLTA